MQWDMLWWCDATLMLAGFHSFAPQIRVFPNNNFLGVKEVLTLYQWVGYSMMMKGHADVSWISLFRAMNWGLSDKYILSWKNKLWYQFDYWHPIKIFYNCNDVTMQWGQIHKIFWTVLKAVFFQWTETKKLNCRIRSCV